MITAIIIIFFTGYFLITIEHAIRINKAATAMVTGVLCWTIYIVLNNEKEIINDHLTEHLGELSAILFFLLGAMTIVELIDAHNGFQILTDKITQTNKKKLLWIVSFLAFFLSPILDNLTTTIVMVTLLRKLVSDRTDKLYFIAMIVIAANAGGAWSPIGDVTTTMLWIGGQVTTFNIITALILPSLACLLIPLVILTAKMKGKVEVINEDAGPPIQMLSRRQQLIVLFSGIIILILVPVFKTLTHLPPYMGILIGLGILWIITELIHGDKDEQDRHTLSVSHALRKIDTPSILFFLGILLAIAALETSGVLHTVAEWLDMNIKNTNLVVILLGLLSAIIDNVPLVAASQGMYGLDQFPVDDPFWEFLAYCTGTGGSLLIIGSAAGVAAMGMEKINFFWYFKKISWIALLGFLAGAIIYLLQVYIM